MEIVDECYECVLNRARGIIGRSDIPVHNQQKLIANIKSEAKLLTPEESWLERIPKIICPAQLGTLRQLVLEKVGLGDTYKREKELGISIGKHLISLIPTEPPDLRTAIMYSLFGNGIEFDVGGNYNEMDQLKEGQKLQEFIQDGLLIEKVTAIANKIVSDIATGSLVLFFLDNVGEHILDSVLIDCLVRIGYNVEIVVKGKPVLNDFSIGDSTDVFQDIKIWNTGSSDVGLFLSRIPTDLHNRMNQSQLLIIKGMAQFETLSSEILSTSALFLFKAKCNPVAVATESQKDDFVAHYQIKGEAWL